ncbi:MAG: sigma-54 dependent transcriptional regulator [Acidobacteria bacterium]|nr:sigma-54 dependent transcriptional regulator [Acidobacteriota bacterium]
MIHEIFLDLPVLFVDDEKEFLSGVEFNLKLNGISHIHCCQDSRHVLPLLDQQKFAMIFLDLLMPHITGEELLPKIVGNYPDIPVIILTAYNQVDKAVKCMKNGALDYLVKPIETPQLIKIIKQTLDLMDMKKENVRLTESILSETPQNEEAFAKIITKNGYMIRIFKYIEAIAASNMPVLITGENGDGKDLIAEAIYKISRRKGEFVPFTAGGIDDHEFADALFGHEKGSFTGAIQERMGLLEKAKDGILFLDEIGDISEKSQVTLLRLIQNREYYPLGSCILKTTNTRFIAATCKDLPALVKENKFRNDLYHRLKVHHVKLPALRERKDDIPLLADYFLKKSAEELNKKKPSVSKELYILLSNYDFPGNVRELKGMMHDALTQHTSGVLSIDVFRDYMRDKGVTINIPIKTDNETNNRIINFGETFPKFTELEEMYISEALNRAKDDLTVSKLTGLSKKDFENRRRKYQKKGNSIN